MGKTAGGKRNAGILSAEDLYRSLLALFYGAVLYIFLGRYIKLQDFHFLHVLSGVFAVIFVSLFVSLKGRMKLMAGAFFLSLVVLVGSLVEWKNVREILVFYPKWLFKKTPETDRMLRTGCECIQAGLLFLAGFLLAFLVSGRAVWKAVISGICFAGLIVLMANGVRVPHLGSVVVIVLLVMSVTELLRQKSGKQKKGSGARFLMYIAPVFLIYGALVYTMPAPEKPYDWATFRDAYRVIEERVRKFSQNLVLNRGRAYSFSYSGFSEDAYLGGDVRAADRENLVLDMRYRLGSTLYLEGRIMDTFDGKEWIISENPEGSDYALDSFMTFYAVSEFDPSYPADYLTRDEMTVTYRYLKTDAVFLPQKCYFLESENNEKLKTDADGNLFFRGRRGYGTAYRVKYSRMNLGSPYFRTLLESEPLPPDPEELNRQYYRFTSGDSPYMVQDLKDYSERMHRIFGQAPEISGETAAYLEEALQGTEEGSLDRLYRIEELLSSYEYSASPGRLPKSIGNETDFLDYFLLEKRSGYCSYFATAFVLLARNEGYPARYVQGFLVSPGDSGTMIVKSSMSHAWPEVFMDGIGWIPFEPTPGYASYRYTAWRTAQREEKESSDGSGTGMMPEELPTEEGEAFDPDLIRPAPEEEEEFDFHLLYRVIRSVLLSLGVLLALLVLFVIFERIILRIRYLRKDPKGRFILSSERLLLMLAAFGVRRRDNETIRELSIRARKTLPLNADALSFLNDYEAVLYGGSFREKQARGKLDSCTEELYKALRESKPLRYVLFRIIYG